MSNRRASQVARPAEERLGPTTAQLERPARVVMLVRWLGVGGTQHQALELSRELGARGATMFVLTRRARGQLRTEIVREVAVHRVGAAASPSLSAMTFLVGSLRWMMRHRHDFDLIHACNLPSGLTAALLGPLLRKPVIVKLPNAPAIAEFGRRRLGKMRWRLLRRAVDRFLAMTVEIEGALEDQGIPRSRIVRIPNGVAFPTSLGSARSASALRNALGLSPSDRVAISVGSLTPVKGHDWLLRAWQIVLAREPACRLLLVGRGPERERLELLARSLGITHSVRLLGGRPDVDELLPLSTVFVLPSRSEGMSNALLEAMSYGLAAVASDIPANREVIDHGVSGLMVPFGDAESLATAIAKLFREPALRHQLGVGARHAVARRFALSQIAAAHESLYGQLTGKAVPCQDS